ncbi:MAG: PLP-dependent cysteine synthase family protein [Alphaproteobacteria bacterium]|nr:PLP-dependent cysteine synthase family protein [Alphaproteobacteria bacterium]
MNDQPTETNGNPKIISKDASCSLPDRMWVSEAVERIDADFNRSADTHLIKVGLSGFEDIDLYLKDESTHPSGSLKHRLARSLFLYGLCNGRIRKGTPIIEASSGSTAISEAYFARLLGLPFMAVVPEATSQQKIEQIEFFGGECVRVSPHSIYDEAEALAVRLHGHYMDQFNDAAHATDWRGNNNIAESIFEQMARERHPVPKWIVVSAGTGGTAATIGRFIRYQCEYLTQSQLCVVDPENSVFFDFFCTGDGDLTTSRTSRIEGIGRPRVESSFIPEVIDRMIQVPDAASIGTIWWLEAVLGRKCGGSTGTNVFGALNLMNEMRSRGERGSVVTLICDPGERYLGTYYDHAWVADQNLDAAFYRQHLSELIGQT